MTEQFLPSVIVLVACGAPIVTDSVATAIAGVPIGARSVSDYGADPSLSDNRAAIQKALDANIGGSVYLPQGRWTVGRAGSAYWCLSMPMVTRLVGDGELVMAAGIAPSVRLVEMDADGAILEGISLDGQRGNQEPSTNPQRHGVFVRNYAILRRVRAHDFAGDGIYLSGGADGVLVEGVTAESNARNGMTLGSSPQRTTIVGSTFRANGAQQIDSEPGTPGHVDDVRITGCTIDVTDGRGGLASNDYALTICGSVGGQSSRWVVTDNVINGAVNVTWASDVVLARNHGTNPTTKPWLIYRTTSDVTIGCPDGAAAECTDGNDITAPASPSVIAVMGTGSGQASTRLAIGRNRLVAGSGLGIRVEGAVSLVVRGNDITNPSTKGYAAIAVRATDPNWPTESVGISGNHASGWSLGIWSGGVAGSQASITSLVAKDNQLSAPMRLDDNSGALRSAELARNSPGTVTRWPANAVVSVIGDTTYMTVRSP